MESQSQRVGALWQSQSQWVGVLWQSQWVWVSEFKSQLRLESTFKSDMDRSPARTALQWAHALWAYHYSGCISCG